MIVDYDRAAKPTRLGTGALACFLVGSSATRASNLRSLLAHLLSTSSLSAGSVAATFGSAPSRTQAQSISHDTLPRHAPTQAQLRPSFDASSTLPCPAPSPWRFRDPSRPAAAGVSSDSPQWEIVGGRLSRERLLRLTRSRPPPPPTPFPGHGRIKPLAWTILTRAGITRCRPWAMPAPGGGGDLACQSRGLIRLATAKMVLLLLAARRLAVRTCRNKQVLRPQPDSMPSPRLSGAQKSALGERRRWMAFLGRSICVLYSVLGCAI
jgi:hypothetical protein